MTHLFPRKAVLDTNVFLLFLVSRTDRSLLTRWKRVDTFNSTDIDLLSDILRNFTKYWTTPHILTEISNFVDQAPRHVRPDLVRAFQRYIRESREHYEEATYLSNRDEFHALALADTGLVSLSSKAAIITTDFALANRIFSSGGYAINFNHLRGKTLLAGLS